MRKKFYIIIFIFLFLYSLYYFALPNLIKPDFVKKVIKNETGIDIEYKNLQIKTGLIPSLVIRAEELSGSDDFAFKNPSIQISLLPFLYKTLSIKNFSSDNIDIKLNIDESGNLFIGSYQLRPINSKLNLKLSSIKINSLSLGFDDNKNQKHIKLNGKNIEIKEDKEVYVNAYGDININNKVSNFILDIKIPDKKHLNNIYSVLSISDIDLSEISNYITKISKNRIEYITGNINTNITSNRNTISTKINSKNFSIKIKDIEKSIYIKNKTDINGLLTLTKNKIEIKDLNIKSKGLTAKLWGTLGNINSQTPEYDITFNLTDTNSETLLPLIPYIDSPDIEINLKKMRDYGIFGIVNGELNIKGKDKEPDLEGQFIAKEVYVLKPLNIPKATVKLDFKDKQVYFDAFAPASKTQHVKVIGKVELYGDKNCEIDIQSTPAVNLKTAQLILNPLHEILDFEIGPVPIMDIHGIGNIKLKVYGNKQTPHLFGKFNFKKGTVSFNDINAKIKNASGELLFQDENFHFTSHYAQLNNTLIKVEGDCSTKGILDFNVTSNGQSLNEMLKILNTSKMLSYINKYTKPITSAAGKINLFIKLKGEIKHIEEFELGKTVISSGNIKLLNNDVMIGKALLLIKNITGDIAFNNKDIDFNLAPLIGNKRIKFSGKIKDDKIYLHKKLQNIALKIKDSDILIKSGEIIINKDKIILNKIFSEIDSKPMLIQGYISNILTTPKPDLYISSSLTQQFIDKYINKTIVYPLILKGDIKYNARINGSLDSLRFNGTINMLKGSSIYHKSAIIDACESPLKLNLNLVIKALESKCYIKKFQYSKLDTNNNVIPLVSANGNILYKNKNILFKDFNVHTQNPTDARIFNIIFKKPLIKEGLFTSDLTLNGQIYSPIVIGTLNIFGINIPFLDTTIKDICMNFKNKTADINLKAEFLSNNITFNANIQNTLTPPYVVNKADLSLGNFDVNSFLKHLNRISIEDVDKKLNDTTIEKIDIRNLIINELNIKAKSVNVRNLFAKDVDVTISLMNSILKLEKLNFVTAEGTINGKLVYNFLTSKMALSLLLDKINANTISKALFEINDQFFGDLNGEANLTCEGKTHEECMKTLSGECKFSVLNGKMPKLGSLEYLLKSSNIIKSGITGLTINNIIELLTPLKTGEFESIKGNFTITQGVTNDIKIASKGKDLSIFITGKYNFDSTETDLEIYGRLAKKISTSLGIIGNLSINTLFNTIPGINLSETNQAGFIQLINKIPGIELNTNDFRIFFVKIDGIINDENYRQIFKWIN